MKFYSVIESVGEESLGFLGDKDTDMVVLFGKGAPKELADISLIHGPSTFLSDVGPGDMVLLGEKVFSVTAVGETANKTLRELGHCTLCFKGGTEPERPGMIMMDGDCPLKEEDITVGTVIEIH